MSKPRPTKRNIRLSRGGYGRWSILNSLGPVVYALRLDDDLIKIGFTTNLSDRERTVRRQAGSATSELLAFMPGEYADEQEIHAALSEHRHHGREYYRPTPAVLEVVNEMRERLNLPHTTISG